MKPDAVDNILDEALSEYRDSEPLSGLEERLLRRLQLQRQTQRSLWWRWTAAVAGLALVATVTLVLVHNRQRAMAAAHQFAAQASIVGKTPLGPVPKKHGLPSEAHGNAESRLSTRRQVAFAKQHFPRNHVESASFPTAAPLSLQERSLFRLAKTHPEALREAAGTNTQLAIAPIDIQPLSDSFVESRENQ